jgi:LuxR family transcriptional regulator, quorum-sensing system regulator BjaR1
MTQITNPMRDAIDALERAPSLLKVKEVVRGVAERHGFSSFLCSAPPSHGKQTVNPILFETWPDMWRRTYIDRRHYAYDPMLKEISRTIHPFLWSTTMKRRVYSKREIAVMNEAAEANMPEGFVVPMYGIGGSIHALTLTGENPRVDTTARGELHIVSIYACNRAKQLHALPGKRVELSDRECEALRWASMGKTDPEIGVIMKISASGAHKLVESAKRKFNVLTRMQAVLEAIRQGYIQL